MVFSLLSLVQAQATTRVLVLGGSQPYLGSREQAFPPSAVASNFAAILAGDSGVSQPVSMQWRDTFQTNATSVFCGRTLMSWFYWPDRHTRTLNLLHAGWDYVVMMDDAYVASTFPEYHLEGVRAISEEVRKEGGRPVLVMMWSSGSTTLTNFEEMAYRVGDGLGVPVAPAGLAWSHVSAGLKDYGPRPTPCGAYVTAATLYSRLFNRTAKVSAYVPSGLSITNRDTLADTAFFTVQTAAARSHYSGSYAGPTRLISPANNKRYLECADFNSSTESGIAAGWDSVMSLARVRWYRYTSSYQSFPTVGHAIDFCQSRFYNQAYLPRWTSYASFDYIDNHGENTMIYGLDRVMCPIPHPEQETGAADVTSSFRNQGEYFVPIRLLWSRVWTTHPEIPCQPDGHHMSGQLFQGVAAMMYTLLSGRCPVGAEPSNTNSVDWQNWFCRKTGYEIAWQLATLNSRVPGFEVLPRTDTATNVTLSATETLTVRFLYAPTSTVTVAILVDNTNAAFVNPATMTFTPINYSTPQTVSIRGKPGAISSEAFNVTLAASSSDGVFNALHDQWAYNTVRSQVP